MQRLKALEIEIKTDTTALEITDDGLMAEDKSGTRLQLDADAVVVALGVASNRELADQLRDDDNIYLGRIEAQLLAAVQEAKRRLENRTDGQDAKVLRQVLGEVDFGTESKKSVPATTASGDRFQARQLIGQPAGPGIARGKARVVRRHSDLADFKHGEVLVCDAVDPSITFVVPLATAVVERRGGMLIHGAIIAREYGLPCITGIPDATTLIRTGEEITVDGYLGIVTLGDTRL